MRPSCLDLAAKVIQLVNDRAEIRTLVSRFQIQGIKNNNNYNSKQQKASTRMTSLSKGRSSYIAHMEVRVVFHVTVVWLSQSPIIQGGSHLFLLCLKHIFNDQAKVLSLSRVDDVTTSS